MGTTKEIKQRILKPKGEQKKAVGQRKKPKDQQEGTKSKIPTKGKQAQKINQDKKDPETTIINRNNK
jgi:hypothetical protein